jgi:hypothetical protein
MTMKTKTKTKMKGSTAALPHILPTPGGEGTGHSLVPSEIETRDASFGKIVRAARRGNSSEALPDFGVGGKGHQ